MASRIGPACLKVGAVLACLVATGCAHATPSKSSGSPNVRAELAQGRGEASSYADKLAAAVRKSGIAPSPAVLGSYQACPGGVNHVAYSEAITVKADVAITESEMSRDISGMLGSEGWKLVSVNFAKVHLALADTDHPLYNISRQGLMGAANILPYGADSSGAIIFMHSSCINAGKLAKQFIPESS